MKIWLYPLAGALWRASRAIPPTGTSKDTETSVRPSNQCTLWRCDDIVTVWPGVTAASPVGSISIDAVRASIRSYVRARDRTPREVVSRYPALGTNCDEREGDSHRRSRPAGLPARVERASS